ncbi:hypothetical protein F7308_0121 [Francisella salina]|uniref:Uncharacterized protein n=1 Tax=Francisella salina TaxID=573569 RepID=A0ABN3ZPS2_FRAST|nr:hypothetical protein F7308_0121 [Francisella salina]
MVVVGKMAWRHEIEHIGYNGDFVTKHFSNKYLLNYIEVLI